VPTTRKHKVVERRTAAPKAEPIAPPAPPASDVPPITTAANEFNVWVPAGTGSALPLPVWIASIDQPTCKQSRERIGDKLGPVDPDSGPIGYSFI
jgi:hypothetical protein